jgi:hypothetical protein
MTIDVIRLAKEAHGALITEDYPGHTGQLDPWTLRLLARHTSLVVEECAKVCDEVSLKAAADWKLRYELQDQGREMGAEDCAEAIRARKPA